MGQPFVGEIRMVGFNFAPLGWAFCDGQLMPISENDTLFNLIGTTYGGDGLSTFGLPNLQSRVPIHQGSRQGSSFTLGQMAGEEAVTLNAGQVPAHTHSPQCNPDAANSVGPSNRFWADWNSDQYSHQAPNALMHEATIGATGGSQPHDNMLPFLAINFVISLFGIYPSQS